MMLSLFVLTIFFAVSRASDKHGGFSYDPESPVGPPTKWGTMEGFDTCGSGKSQSPINIPPTTSKLPAERMPEIHPTEGEWKFEGSPFNFAFLCENEKCGKLMVEKNEYEFVNIHFHSPSEHTIKGERYPLEAHMVHKSSDGNLAVIGFLFQAGTNNKVLEAIFKAFGKDSTPYMKHLYDHDGENHLLGKMFEHSGKNSSEVIPLDFHELVKSNGFYTYSGSLTTPPCTEGVTWFVCKEAKTLSHEQVEYYVGQIESDGQGDKYGNNRPVNPLNGRTVYEIEGSEE